MQSRNVNDAADYHFNEGMKLKWQGNYADAIVQYSKAIALGKDNAFIYRMRGYAYIKLKKYTEAIADYDIAISLDPNNSNAYINRGSAYEMLEKYTEAIADYEKALAINPDGANAKENLARTEKAAAKQYYEEGKKLAKQGKYADAIEQFSNAIALDKANADIYHWRGHTYDNMKKHTKTIADYDMAISLNPNNSIAYNNRGLAYEKLGKYTEAIADYKKALAINPDITKTKEHLARTEKAAAKQYYEEGKKLTEQEKYADAIEQFSKAIALDKADAHIYHARGRTYDDMKKYTEAIADYDIAIQLNPNNSAAYHNRGYTYNNLGQYTKAIADCDIAIQLIPNSITYNNRGFSYQKLEKYTEAIADYKKALAINPDNADAKSNLKDAEKAQSKQKISLLSQRSKDSFAALNLNGRPPSAIPAALLSMMKQEDELLAALLEYTQKSDKLNADTARSITAAINQWRHYPLIACPQPSEEVPSLTPHISDFLRRKEAIYRYIAEVRQALLQIKDAVNTPSWKIKHWLTGAITDGTPRHIKQIKTLLSSINEYSSTEAVMNAYEQLISLLPTSAKKSRLPETAAFYDLVKFNLNQIMFNPPAAYLPAAEELAVEGPSLEEPPSYDEHTLREREQLGVLKDWFPHHTIDVTANAYFLRDAGSLYPVIINKLRFNEDVAEKSKPVEVRPAPLFSAAESAAIAQAPASAVATPVISSSSSSFFAAKPVLLSAADAAAIDITDALERQLPPVPTHPLPEVKSANNNAHAPAQRQMMLA